MSAPLTASTLVTSMLVRGLSLDRQAPLLKFHTLTSPLSQPGRVRVAGRRQPAHVWAGSTSGSLYDTLGRQY